MGFRCPNCKKDFGHDKEAFKQHIESSFGCKANAVSTLYYRLKNDFELSESISEKTNDQEEVKND